MRTVFMSRVDTAASSINALSNVAAICFDSTLSRTSHSAGIWGQMLGAQSHEALRLDDKWDERVLRVDSTPPVLSTGLARAANAFTRMIQ